MVSAWFSYFSSGISIGLEIRGRKAILDTKTGSIVNILERTKE
jgi:hypothetical protein